MKIALAQCNYHIGNFSANEAAMTENIRLARKAGADLIIFSELSVCGYPPADFLEFDDFISLCHHTAMRLADQCTGIAAIVGVPEINEGTEGKGLFNAAWMLSEGKIVAKTRKTLLPTYDIFDENRYFEANTQFEVIPFKEERIALTICEDLWDIGPDPIYTSWPMEELAQKNPTLIINISGSPYHQKQQEERHKVLMLNALKYHLPLLYVNQVGAQTELLFDGGSMAMNSRGQVVRQLPWFSEALEIVETKDLDTLPSDSTLKPPAMQMLYDALVTGIRDYFRKTGIRKAILGLSGGIDSAVVLVLAVEALGASNVQALLLPSRYSSEHSVTDALELADKLSVPNEVISIEESFKAFEKTLATIFHDRPPDITEENIQARCRALILMACSNKFGSMLLNTSNKSEAAVGYGTLYGDMCGGLSVIGDLYKTEVYKLAAWINRNGIIIPENIILKAPSAELRPDQKDEDSLPPYPVLDQVLYRYIEEGKGPEEIIANGFGRDTVLRILRLVNSNEHKRRQAPPVLRVSSKAFGYGRRMPVAAKYLC
jgi:NAD+ synthase (glutamine-hydrolysing)